VRGHERDLEHAVLAVGVVRVGDVVPPQRDREARVQQLREPEVERAGVRIRDERHPGPPR
jgi:hypothetical protein